MAGSESDGMELVESLLWQYFQNNDLGKVLTGRRLASTKTGKIGVVPMQAQTGDIVVFLPGSLVSLLLRPDPAALSADLESEIKKVLGVNVTSDIPKERESYGC